MSVRTRGVVWLAAVFGVMAAERTAVAQYHLLLEVGAGATIPVTQYFSVQSEDGYAEAENGPHAGVGVGIVIKGFQLRYAASLIKLGVGKRRWPTSSLQKLNTFFQGLGQGPIPQQGSENLDATITFHTVTVGYRFDLTKTRWQPYIPLEIGGVFAMSGDVFDDKTLYGMTVGVGFGLDVQVYKAFYLGLAVRYNFVLTESIPEVALVGLTSDTPSFESAVAMAHLISVTLQTQVRF